jgi:hypothetical protein
MIIAISHSPARSSWRTVALVKDVILSVVHAQRWQRKLLLCARIQTRQYQTVRLNFKPSRNHAAFR